MLVDRLSLNANLVHVLSISLSKLYSTSVGVVSFPEKTEQLYCIY